VYLVWLVAAFFTPDHPRRRLTPYPRYAAIVCGPATFILRFQKARSPDFDFIFRPF
jgi:hypothetical protein